MELTDGIDQVVDVGYNKMLSGHKDFFRILVSPSKSYVLEVTVF